MSEERKILTEEEYKNDVKPFYDFDPADGIFVLEESKGVLTINGNEFIVDAKAVIDFRRKASFLFEIFSENSSELSVYMDKLAWTQFGDVKNVPEINVLFKYKNKNVDGQFFVLYVKSVEPYTCKAVFYAQKPSYNTFVAMGDARTNLRKVLLHVMNFTEMCGVQHLCKVTNDKGGCKAIAYAKLMDEGWSVSLKTLLDCKEKEKKLSREGGYQLTHLIEFTKVDNSGFSVKEAETFIDFLDFFMSFSKGNMCRSVCPVGYDENNNIVWKFWNHPGESWKRPMTWVHYTRLEWLVELCPKMYLLWNTECWNSSLRTIIYWYITVNNFDTNIDANIILTYTALERISYEYCVNEKKLISKDGFVKLRGSDNIRMLVSSLGIPVTIPESRESLKIFLPAFADIPHALNAVRNSIVHPDNKNHDKYKKLIVDVHYLGLWYLELAILRLCDYNGWYCNRLKEQRENLEYVPWKKEIDYV